MLQQVGTDMPLPPCNLQTYKPNILRAAFFLNLPSVCGA